MTEAAAESIYRKLCAIGGYRTLEDVKPLETGILRLFRRLRLPGFVSLVLCECGAAYFHEEALEKLPRNEAGSPLCQHIRLPAKSNGARVCGTALYVVERRREHARVTNVYLPIRPFGAYMPLRLFLYRLISTRTVAQVRADFTDWPNRVSRDPNIIASIYDSLAFKRIEGLARNRDSNAIWLFFGLHFDLVSMFARDHRSNAETRKKKCGLLHGIILNLLAELRFREDNLYIPCMMEDEPAKTIWGYMQFLVDELLALWKDGLQAVTKDKVVITIKGALVMLTGDTPARSKAAGSPHHSRQCACPRCKKLGAPVKGNSGTPAATVSGPSTSSASAGNAGSAAQTATPSRRKGVERRSTRSRADQAPTTQPTVATLARCGRGAGQAAEPQPAAAVDPAPNAVDDLDDDQAVGDASANADSQAPPHYSWLDMTKGDPRTHEGMLSDCEKMYSEATTLDMLRLLLATATLGYRWSPLHLLPYFNLIQCCAIDVMHAILEGILKTILAIYIKEDDTFAARAQGVLDAMQQSGCVPTQYHLPANFMTRIPSAKSEEMLRFLNIFSVVVMRRVLPPAEAAFWTSLQACCEDVFLAHAVHVPRMKEVEEEFPKLITDWAKRRKDAILPFNFHLCLHIVESIWDLGPTPETWCFRFEAMMGRVSKLTFSGSRKGILTTISKAFVRDMHMRALLDAWLEQHALRVGYANNAAVLREERQILNKDYVEYLKHQPELCLVVERPDAHGRRRLTRAQLFRSSLLPSMADFESHKDDVGEELFDGLQMEFAGKGFAAHIDKAKPPTSWPLWYSQLLDFLYKKGVALIAEPGSIMCFNKVSIAGVPFKASTDHWRLHHNTTFDLQRMDVTNGSGVSAVYDAQGLRRKDNFNQEYFGEILSFLQVKVLRAYADGHRQDIQLRLFFTHWREFVQLSDEQVRAVKEADGRCGHEAARLRLSAKVHSYDCIVPITRIRGRVAFVPVHEASSTRSAQQYEVIRLPLF